MASPGSLQKDKYTMSEIEKRLMTLELSVAEQDQIVQDLSDMVNNQWQEIERLRAKLTTAHQRIISLEESVPTQGGQPEKPPHY
ncbi:MAG: SlyX protein [Sneathiella sp.]|jgi:SlyX protein